MTTKFTKDDDTNGWSMRPPAGLIQNFTGR